MSLTPSYLNTVSGCNAAFSLASSYLPQENCSLAANMLLQTARYQRLPLGW
jgi:hypothetical protein